MEQEKQLTACQILIKEINKRGPKENNPPLWVQEIYNKALATERQQLIDAVNYGANEDPSLGEEYYNNTFKTQ